MWHLNSFYFFKKSVSEGKRPYHKSAHPHHYPTKMIAANIGHKDDENSKVQLDPRDANTPDRWIKRHPELIRLTGKDNQRLPILQRNNIALESCPMIKSQIFCT